MEFDLRVRGLTRRWFLNIFLLIACSIVSMVTLFCVFFSGYYTRTALNIASEYSSDFWVLSSVASERFEDVAKEYAETFAYKDKIEVQVINGVGEIIVSTSGFVPDNTAAKPDYEAALKNTNGVGTYSGKSESGEKIICETYLLADGNDSSGGAIRWLISAESISNHILFVQIATVSLGIVLLAFFGVSGMFFVSSIIKPLREVSAAARKIAMGDFSTTLKASGKNEITELCDSINFMASELKQAENMKNDFISSVSHELRTPLTAIRGWGETAKMSVGVDNELVEKGIDVVLNETGRLSGLVEELLDFSRMQNGRLKVEMSPIKASQALSAAVDMYVELTKQQKIELIFMPLKNEPYILGDINRLKQVFINVIDNAVKYTSAGGQIIAQMQLEQGCITVKLSDTGAGIPAQDIDRVKEKFYKSDKSVRGSGIGLAVADEIIKQHGGLLFLESTEGVGTTVTAVLPVFDEGEQQNSSSSETVSLDKAAHDAAEQIAANAVNQAENDSVSENNNE